VYIKVYRLTALRIPQRVEIQVGRTSCHYMVRHELNQRKSTWHTLEVTW